MEASSSMSYRGMNDDFVIEVGKITMARAALEETVYVVAEDMALSIAKPIREVSATKAAERIREQAFADPLPPWVGSDITQQLIADWSSEAKGALTDAHKIVHSDGYLRVGSDEAWAPERRETGVRRAETSTKQAVLERLRKRLDNLDGRGKEIRIGIVPMSARGMYTPYFTADRGAIISNYEGAWYRLPGTREEAYEMARRTHEWCTSILERRATPALLVDSPAGARHVPPWFTETEPEPSSLQDDFDVG